MSQIWRCTPPTSYNPQSVTYGAFTPAIWSTIGWTEKFNNGLCTQFLQLCGMKSSRSSSCLKNRRCELSRRPGALVTLDLTSKRKTYLFLNKCLVLNVGMDSQPFFLYKESKCHQFVFVSREHPKVGFLCFHTHYWAVFSNVTEWYLLEVLTLFAQSFEAFFG